MKICAIRDEYHPELGAIGYLFYYDNSKRFYIEISDGLDYWTAPPIIDSFVKKKQNYVDSKWSIAWVRQRIIPPDRQNIGAILKAQGMKEYNEYNLLVFSDGRCAQDECMVEEIHEDDLPDEIKKRMQYRVKAVFALPQNKLLVYFRDSSSVVCDVKQIVANERQFAPVLNSKEIFQKVMVSEGGYGVRWGSDVEIPDYMLKAHPVDHTINFDELQLVIEQNLYDTSQTMERLHCTRQNIDDLVKRGKLPVIKTSAKNKLFLRSDVEERLW